MEGEEGATADVGIALLILLVLLLVVARDGGSMAP